MQKASYDLSIVLSGEAGQGLKTLEVIFAKIAKAGGFHVFTYTEFMSRIRGGNNTTEIRIASVPCPAFVDRIDIAVSLQKEGLRRIAHRVTDGTVLIGDEATIDAQFRGHGRLHLVPLGALARESGGAILLNTVVLGMLCALMCLDKGIALSTLKNTLKRKDEETLAKNETAFGKGYNEGERIRTAGKMLCGIPSRAPVAGDHLLYGSEGVGMGAIAGGCTFVASYPMSPSTSILEFMAQQAASFGVVVEQAEDEIAAINMAVASWYAGGRAMVTTSGGGFALMEEGVSLAGAMESPLVVHLAQRPGPATGLPTRTEQADLNLALYAGHGEFPRVIYTPADFKDSIDLTCRAFNVADKYQIPVFVLTDQYFLDSSYNTSGIDLTACKEEKHIVETDKAYRRYAFTESGISSRGIPGLGRGIVCADSDEHDEGGYITEDFTMRTAMVEKRNRRLHPLTEQAIPPRFSGHRSYTTILVGWGSTFHTLNEALAKSGREDVAFLHFSQVYPVSRSATQWLEKAALRVTVENNATAQFGTLLTQVTGISFHKKILKYNGMPFSVEEITEAIRQL
ncbi:MAG: 2-oxoacid:acceptor oxidoreductase subunit alpha [Chitinispirillaceae bacterium]|nr:2-oxoacid:acceptor oxidoreductase subunit alpha [Chitinispirillaceae bacterium]